MTLSADELKELRAKAEAAIALAPKEDWYADHDLTRTVGPGLLHEDAAFIAALNPATALSLIQAAELNAELVGALMETWEVFDALSEAFVKDGCYDGAKGSAIRRKAAAANRARQALSKAKGSAGHE